MRNKLFFYIALVGITVLFNDVITSPIFSVEVDRLKSRDGKVTLLQYIDIPEGIKESVDLNCGTPSGTKYDWNIYSKMGAPHAGHMSLGKPTPKNIDVPYMTTIRQHEYPWTLLLVTCDVYMESENKSGKDLLLLTYAWIIMKMKSSTDRPFHPIICEYDDAQCVRAKHDCMYDKYGYDYRGQHDRTSDGIQCQPWGSRLPNYAKRMDGTDTFGGHRYCRNAEKTFKTQPICVWNVDSRVDPVAIGSEGKYKLCTVPKCHDCMYGRGNGEYPGTVPYTGDLAEAFAYPKYDGKNGFTKIEAVNARGKTTYQKCHRGKNEYWNDNNCRIDPKVGSRRPHDQKANLRCLGIPDLTKDETDFPEDPHWSRYKWVDCIVPQCTVRQVWFLMVTDDNKPLFNVDNSRHFEITVMKGITKTIRFYHFGTTFCKGMSIDTERNLQPFLKAFTIRCKPTPQLSEFEIRSPTRDYEGNYNLKYTFPEGDEHIESKVYKMNFKLVVKNPTTISLTKTEVCPGYPTETQLEVHGSFKLESNSIQWYYRDKNQNNGDKWSSIETLSLNNFELSSDEKRLRLKRLKNEIELKVNAKSMMGSEVTAQVDVKILSEPRLTVQEPNIVAELDKPIKMSVECESKAKTTWIFEGQVLSDNHGDYNMRSIMNENDETVRTDTLSIRTFRPTHEGIYTVIVENEKCKYKLCTVPKCHDCMYGRGNGEYPGTVPYTGDLAEAFAYPKYDGKNGFTTIEAVNARGKTTYQKCHRGKNEYWNDNNCRVDPKVGSRRPHDRNANLRCLGIPDLTKDETDFPEDPHWSRYKWVDCIVLQCTVRQVWFLMVTDDNKPLFNVDNSRHFEITVMKGITKTIRFYHFGTTFCKGMSIETERNLQPFLKAFTIRCKPTPQLSEFEIRSPTRDYEGNYNLKYTFPEGDEHVENTVYKMNFKLVVKNPTTISLTKTEVCPGYPTETQLEVHGSFKLESNSIEWYYRDKNQNNGDKWSSIETLSLNNFELSADEKRLRLKRLKNEIELKVNAKSTMGSKVTAQVDVKILSEPRLTVQEPNIVAELDKPIKMSVECESKAKTTWIFEGQVLSDNHGDYNMRSIMNENDETVRTDTLSIRTFRPTHEGIYTVIVENEKCKTIKDIFVTVG